MSRRPSPEAEPERSAGVSETLARSDTEIDTDSEPGPRTTDWEVALIPGSPAAGEGVIGLLMVADAGGGLRMVRGLRSRDRLAQLLNEAALDPAAGTEPGWPRRILVTDPDLADALHVDQLPVVLVKELPTLESQAVRSLDPADLQRFVEDHARDESADDDLSDEYTSDQPMPDLIDADHLVVVHEVDGVPTYTFQLAKRDAELVAKVLAPLSSLLVVRDAGGAHLIGSSPGLLGLVTFVEPGPTAEALLAHAATAGAQLGLQVTGGGVARRRFDAPVLALVLPLSIAKG